MQKFGIIDLFSFKEILHFNPEPVYFFFSCSNNSKDKYTFLNTLKFVLFFFHNYILFNNLLFSIEIKVMYSVPNKYKIISTPILLYDCFNLIVSADYTF